MPPFGIALVAYIICGGLLWFVAHLLAPMGYAISLWRGVGAVLLITIFGSFSSAFLKPAIGDWHMLVDLFVDVLIVKSVLWLPLGRAIFAVIIYWIVLVTAVYFLVIRPGKRPASRWSQNRSLAFSQSSV
jgi:hypothetical protein